MMDASMWFTAGKRDWRIVYGVTDGTAVTNGDGVKVALAVAEGVVAGLAVSLRAGVSCGKPASRICQAISRSSLAATGKFGRLDRVRSRR